MHVCSSGFSSKMDKHTELQTLSLCETESHTHGRPVYDIITNHICTDPEQFDASYKTAPLQYSQTRKRKKVQDIQVKQHKEILDRK